MKPDVVCVGQNIVSAASDDVGQAIDCGTAPWKKEASMRGGTGFTGTSMSAAVAAGVAAFVIDYFGNGNYPRGDSKSAHAKDSGLERKRSQGSLYNDRSGF